MALCPECYIEDHSSHARRSLKKVYEERKSKVYDGMEPITRKITSLEAKEKSHAQEVNQIREGEKEERESIQIFSEALKEALHIKTERIIAKKTSFADKQISQPLAEARKFKFKVEQMSMVSLVDSTADILCKAEQLVQSGHSGNNLPQFCQNVS